MTYAVKRRLVAGAMALTVFPGCAYFHPVASPRADPTERNAGIHKNVDVGSLVRIRTYSGAKVVGEVVGLSHATIELRRRDQSAGETQVYRLDEIKELEVKTWRKADTVFFTGVGTGLVVLTYIAWGVVRAASGLSTLN